ncbi:MAG: lecithin retinol acyltransferase family protein [Oscillospiraceae bacterium]|nr:lecithin retinol acyltransferase family protein [Oscillospiraceae bacterium]
MNGIITQPNMDSLFDTKEEWVKKSPQKGNHIRVIHGPIAHHGIYISDAEVIHFIDKDNYIILDWEKAEVISSDLDFFLQGGTLEVKEYTPSELDDLYPTEDIVKYARACVGDKGYNLVFNNCEHFANECTLGRFISQQIERVLSGRMPNEEVKNMGILGSIGGFFRGLFGGKSSGGGRSTTTYEPDKVKVAEIEADTKLRLADKEFERIEMMNRARLDYLEFETQSQIALEEARVKGNMLLAEVIVDMQMKLNDIAEKRFAIIEHGSMQIVRDIENYYQDLANKIEADNARYNLEHYPQLLNILSQFEEGSVEYKLYEKRIEQEGVAQAKHYEAQLDAIVKRQQQVFESSLNSKNSILSQVGQITTVYVDGIEKQQTALAKIISGADSANQPIAKEALVLPGSDDKDL